MSSIDSLDNLINASISKGPLTRFFAAKLAATTAPTAASPGGYITAVRVPNVFNMPASLGAGVNAAYLTAFNVINSNGTTTNLIAIETLLGTLTVSGNSFSAGSAMPTKTIRSSGADTSVVTASLLPMLVATTALTATTPTVTLTYTDQDGNTGNTATIVLPTSPAINSAFVIVPGLASGDTGIRAITNMSISTGSAGVLKAYGLLVLASAYTSIATIGSAVPPLSSPEPMYPINASDVLTVYSFGANAAFEISGYFNLVADI